MNEQLQKSLATILEKATNGVEAGVSFLSAEIPDVAHQLLAWKMAESLLVSLVFALIIAGSFVILFKVFKAERGNILHLEEMGIPAVFSSAITSMFSFFPLAENAKSALQIWLAPKIYLIEYAASLVK